MGRVARSRGMRTRDLFLLTRVLLWTLLVPALKRFVPLPKLARLMWVDRHGGRPDRERQQRIVRATRLVLRARPLSRDENCLDRSLILYRFLSREMLDPRLVLGVRRDPGGVNGHAWVTVDGTPVVEASVAGFAPIATFGPAGVVDLLRGHRNEDTLAPFGLRR